MTSERAQRAAQLPQFYNAHAANAHNTTKKRNALQIEKNTCKLRKHFRQFRQLVSLFVCVVSICTICCQTDEDVFLICWCFFYLHEFSEDAARWALSATVESRCWLNIAVMNLVPTHSNCTSPMDYISHHALHSHIPVHHYTNHTAVTIHSSLWLPHHTCTSFSLSHKSSTQTLTQCEVLFSPG